MLTRIDARNFSCDSAIDFFYVLRTVHGPTHPVSYEYAKMRVCQAISTVATMRPGAQSTRKINGVNPWPLLKRNVRVILMMTEDVSYQLYLLALLKLELNRVGPDME